MKYVFVMDRDLFSIEKVLLQTMLKYGLNKCVLLPSFSSEVHSKDLISQSSV